MGPILSTQLVIRLFQAHLSVSRIKIKIPTISFQNNRNNLKKKLRLRELITITHILTSSNSRSKMAEDGMEIFMTIHPSQLMTDDVHHLGPIVQVEKMNITGVQEPPELVVVDQPEEDLVNKLES
jgi:hypothetical protein